MYILKNAWTSIWRNKGRNILIGIIVIVIAISCTITLAINNSATSLINAYKDSYEATATIMVNRQNFMEDFRKGEHDMNGIRENFNNLSSLTLDEILEYGESEYITRYIYTMNLGMNSKGLEKVTSEMPNEPNDKRFGNQNNMSSSDFTVIGYSNIEAMESFLNGVSLEGEVDTDFTSKTCIVSEELATFNDLAIGDEITLVNPNNSKLTYTLTITGIYSDTTFADGMNLFSASSNQIVTNASVVKSIMEDDEDLKATISPTFYLTSIDVVDELEAQMKEKGMDENYTLSTNEGDEDEALSSISNLKTFSTTFLIITLLIGGIVLLVINMVNIRERKYEIGVLRTIGMKKSLVSLEFATELMIVTIIALVIGLGIGASLSVPTANMLLANEISNAEEKIDDFAGNFGNKFSGNGNEFGGNRGNFNFKVSGVVNVQKVDTINAVVDIKVIFELLGVGILLTIISSLAAISSITHFSPLTILKERS